MSLKTLHETPFLLQENSPDYASFRLYNGKMPALRSQQLRLELYIGNTRAAVNAATGGDATFLLRYKGKEAGLLCLQEFDEGAHWDVVQVKGATSKVSYRVSSSFDVHAFFGRLLRNIADDTRTKVMKLTLPHFSSLLGIEQLPPYRMERVKSAYSRFRSRAGMTFNTEDERYEYLAQRPGNMAS